MWVSHNELVRLQISGQLRRKPWNWGPIRRFFGREFQVFVIKSTAKASNEKPLSRMPLQKNLKFVLRRPEICSKCVLRFSPCFAFRKSVNNGRSSKFLLASKQGKKRFKTHLFPSLVYIICSYVGIKILFIENNVFHWRTKRIEKWR